MSSHRVRLPAALQNYTGGDAVVEVYGSTLDELFDQLDRRYPGLRFRVVDEQGQLRAHMRLFVEGTDVRELSRPLGPHDSVVIVLALSGG